MHDYTSIIGVIVLASGDFHSRSKKCLTFASF